MRSERFTASAIDGTVLHALHWGEVGRPILVLLHGGGANAHWWDHLAPALATCFHVVALDFRGHGDSDRTEEIAAGAFELDLAALLAHLGSDRVVLAGHSMGARVALDHATRTARTRALVLLDPARGASRRSHRTARLALTLRRSYRTREDAISRFRFVPPADHVSETLRRDIAAKSLQREPDGRFGYKFDPRWFALPARPRPELSTVSCLTLVLRGSESLLLSRDGARETSAEIPHARWIEIEGAGHHVHLDQPERVLSAMLDFLEPFAAAEIPDTGAAGTL